MLCDNKEQANICWDGIFSSLSFFFPISLSSYSSYSSSSFIIIIIIIIIVVVGQQKHMDQPRRGNRGEVKGGDHTTFERLLQASGWKIMGGLQNSESNTWDFFQRSCAGWVEWRAWRPQSSYRLGQAAPSLMEVCNIYVVVIWEFWFICSTEHEYGKLLFHCELLKGFR